MAMVASRILICGESESTEFSWACAQGTYLNLDANLIRCVSVLKEGHPLHNRLVEERSNSAAQLKVRWGHCTGVHYKDDNFPLVELEVGQMNLCH